MTKMVISVEDDHADELIKMLKELPFVKHIAIHSEGIAKEIYNQQTEVNQSKTIITPSGDQGA